nr:MAG TPA: hypothetical protein [Caudoviricetes sp.]
MRFHSRRTANLLLVPVQNVDRLSNDLVHRRAVTSSCKDCTQDRAARFNTPLPEHIYKPCKRQVIDAQTIADFLTLFHKTSPFFKLRTIFIDNTLGAMVQFTCLIIKPLTTATAEKENLSGVGFLLSKSLVHDQSISTISVDVNRKSTNLFIFC